MKKLCFFALSVMLLSSTIKAQLFTSFSTIDSVQVISNGTTLSLPWAGGLNTPQFSTIDLNGDGVEDLYVFDRQSNSSQTFLNGGTENQFDYSYAWEYENGFPRELANFVLLRDYNCDGHEDIFTSTPGGFRVFTNRALDTIQLFSLYTNYLNSQIYGGPTGVYAIGVDYPAIADMDGDGDLDIINFGVWGTIIDYHENVSTNCDTLKFLQLEACWGNFFENQQNNSLVFNANCKGGTSSSSASRHAGSTLLTLDFDDDGVQDLLMGDVESKRVFGVSNGGSNVSAHMVSVDTTYPSSTTPIDITEFVANFYFDANNDGAKDLVAAPNDQYIHEDLNNTWLYENNGSTNDPDFSFSQPDFLGEHMLDFGTSAYPVLVDVNGDSLLDLIVGNYGYFESEGVYRSQLAYLENTGTAELPVFTLVDDNYLQLDTLGTDGLYPTFGDLDDDGDQDLLIGDHLGQFYYFQNSAGAGNPMQLGMSNPNLNDTIFYDPVYPRLADIDGDSLLDIVAGRGKGVVSAWINQGSPISPSYTKLPTIDTLGGIVSMNLGFSLHPQPLIADIDSSGSKLFVGGDNGMMFVYDYATDYTATYPVLDSFRFNAGRMAMTVGDIIGSDSLELILGQQTGGITLFGYNKKPKLFNSRKERVQVKEEQQFRLYPNPAITGRFTVSANQPIAEGRVQITVYTINGQLALDKTYIGNQHVIQLPKGYYFVKISSSTNHEVHPIIVY